MKSQGTKDDLVFYYDRDCGFCEAATRALETIAPVSTRAASSWDRDLEETVRSTIDSAAIAQEGEQFWAGHRAIGVVLMSSGRNACVRMAGRVLVLEVLDPVWSWIYRQVARNRHLLSKAMGRNSCRIDR